MRSTDDIPKILSEVMGRSIDGILKDWAWAGNCKVASSFGQGLFVMCKTFECTRCKEKEAMSKFKAIAAESGND